MDADHRAARLEELLGRQDILDCLTRFSRGMDRFDRELFLSAFHPDAEIAAGDFVGGPVDLYAWASRMHRDDPVPAQPVEFHRPRCVVRRDGGELLRCGGTDFGLRAAGGDDTRVDRRAPPDHRPDGAGGLSRGVEEGGARPEVVTNDHAPRISRRVREAGHRAHARPHRGRPEFEQPD